MAKKVKVHAQDEEIAKSSYMSQELMDLASRKSKLALNPVKLTFKDLKYEV